ncbi:hypothetical protein U1Q18_035006 [Sarracenia purpurea var. burkii]
MFNKEQQLQYCTSVPRISFSGDFSDAPQLIKCQSGYREPPVSSDFEFSVGSDGMLPADELFFKGKLLPLKENSSAKMTLREELLAEEDGDDAAARPPKGSGGWKERFGLKRAHIVAKKAEKGEDLWVNYI